MDSNIKPTRSEDHSDTNNQTKAKSNPALLTDENNLDFLLGDSLFIFDMRP
jgi:hypothetical protein